MLSLDYIFKASWDIEIGEELFMDYNRSLFCGKCKHEMDFYDQCTKSLRSAIFVEVYARTLKIVIIVKLFWFVFSVMTNHRLKFKKNTDYV